MAANARKRIMQFVISHPDASTGQVARGLGMTVPAVRYHLKILREDGRIQAARLAPVVRNGRPENQFRISELLQGNNLAMVADTALKAAADGASGAQRATLITLLATALRSRLGKGIPNLPAARRMDALISGLNQMHYSAHWEAGAEGPRLHLGRCPYGAIIKDHPELCSMDARAVAEFTGAEVRQLAKIDLDTALPSQCLFSLR